MLGLMCQRQGFLFVNLDLVGNHMIGLRDTFGSQELLGTAAARSTFSVVVPLDIDAHWIPHLVLKPFMMVCMTWVLTSLLWLGCNADQPERVESPEDTSATAMVQDSGVAEDSADDDIPDDCEVPEGFDWNNWGRPFFRTWCSGCHAASATERHGAPEWAVFDTEAQVYNHRAAIRVSVLEMERMPLGGGLPQQESASLDLYLRCVFGR